MQHQPRMSTLRETAPQSCSSQTRWAALCAAALLAVGIAAQAESTASFFRVVGPATGDFTRIESGGALLWTHPVLNATCHVQIATSLLGGGNWRDYAHSFVTTAVTSVKVFDKETPVGMAFVPAGIFSMGDANADHVAGMFGELDEDPVHTVHLGAFYIGTREVTQGEWDSVRAWAIGHGYEIGCAGNGKDANHPVANVCWHDAVLWCNAKSERDGLTPCYYTDSSQTVVYRTGVLDLSSDAVKWDASGYRLPSEAEWEYAARGGAEGSRFAFGPTVAHAQANYFSTNAFAYDISGTGGLHPGYDDAEPCTSPGGVFSGNGYGLCDVVGNVSEWCWDRSDGVTESCDDCDGDGLVACPDCGGAGNVGCSTCGGIGAVACSSCYGSGSVQTTCSDCGGAGGSSCPQCGGSCSVDVDCQDCAGAGSLDCLACGSTGDEMCADCGGSGGYTCSQCAGSGIGSCGICGGGGTEPCGNCSGSGCEACGWTGDVDCSGCGGLGTGPCASCGGDGTEDCFTCGGDGLVDCAVCAGIGSLVCSTCGGLGYVSQTCPTCGGIGGIMCLRCTGSGSMNITCPDCGGGGGQACSDCGGSGSLACSTCGGDGDESCSFCSGRGALWASDYYDLAGACNPRGPSVGAKRIVRGGAWNSDAAECRVSRRAEAPPTEAATATGFRLVRSAAE